MNEVGGDSSAKDSLRGQDPPALDKSAVGDNFKGRDALLSSYKDLLIRLSQAQVRIDQLTVAQELNAAAVQNWKPALREAIIRYASNNSTAAEGGSYRTSPDLEGVYNDSSPLSTTMGDGINVETLPSLLQRKPQIHEKCQEFLKNSDFTQIPCSPWSDKAASSLRNQVSTGPRSRSRSKASQRESADLSETSLNQPRYLVSVMVQLKEYETKIDTIQNDFDIDDFLGLKGDNAPPQDSANLLEESIFAVKSQLVNASSTSIERFSIKWEKLKGEWNQFLEKLIFLTSTCLAARNDASEYADSLKNKSHRSPGSIASLSFAKSSLNATFMPHGNSSFSTPQKHFNNSRRRSKMMLSGSETVAKDFSSSDEEYKLIDSEEDGICVGDDCNSCSITSNDRVSLDRCLDGCENDDMTSLTVRFIRSEVIRIEDKITKLDETISCLKAPNGPEQNILPVSESVAKFRHGSVGNDKANTATQVDSGDITSPKTYDKDCQTPNFAFGTEKSYKHLIDSFAKATATFEQVEEDEESGKGQTTFNNRLGIMLKPQKVDKTRLNTGSEIPMGIIMPRIHAQMANEAYPVEPKIRINLVNSPPLSEKVSSHEFSKKEEGVISSVGTPFQCHVTHLTYKSNLPESLTESYDSQTSSLITVIDNSHLKNKEAPIQQRQQPELYVPKFPQLNQATSVRTLKVTLAQILKSPTRSAYTTNNNHESTAGCSPDVPITKTVFPTINYDNVSPPLDAFNDKRNVKDIDSRTKHSNTQQPRLVQARLCHTNKLTSDKLFFKQPSESSIPVAAKDVPTSRWLHDKTQNLRRVFYEPVISTNTVVSPTSTSAHLKAFELTKLFHRNNNSMIKNLDPHISINPYGASGRSFSCKHTDNSHLSQRGLPLKEPKFDHRKTLCSYDPEHTANNNYLRHQANKDLNDNFDSTNMGRITHSPSCDFIDGAKSPVCLYCFNKYLLESSNSLLHRSLNHGSFEAGGCHCLSRAADCSSCDFRHPKLLSNLKKMDFESQETGCEGTQDKHHLYHYYYIQYLAHKDELKKSTGKYAKHLIATNMIILKSILGNLKKHLLKPAEQPCNCHSKQHKHKKCLTGSCNRCTIPSLSSLTGSTIEPFASGKLLQLPNVNESSFVKPVRKKKDKNRALTCVIPPSHCYANNGGKVCHCCKATSSLLDDANNLHSTFSENYSNHVATRLPQPCSSIWCNSSSKCSKPLTSFYNKRLSMANIPSLMKTSPSNEDCSAGNIHLIKYTCDNISSIPGQSNDLHEKKDNKKLGIIPENNNMHTLRHKSLSEDLTSLDALEKFQSQTRSNATTTKAMNFLRVRKSSIYNLETDGGDGNKNKEVLIKYLDAQTGKNYLILKKTLNNDSNHSEDLKENNNDNNVESSLNIQKEVPGLDILKNFETKYFTMNHGNENYPNDITKNKKKKLVLPKVLKRLFGGNKN